MTVFAISTVCNTVGNYILILSLIHILKGIQVDLGDRRYRTHNEINVEALESEFQLSIHNDAHFGATVRKGSRLLDRMLARKLPLSLIHIFADMRRHLKQNGFGN